MVQPYRTTSGRRLLLPAVQEALQPYLKDRLRDLSPGALLALAVGLSLLAAGLGRAARWLWSRRVRTKRSQ